MMDASQVEERMQCSESGAVSYKRDVANVLALDIDSADATNREELEEYQVSVPQSPNQHMQLARHLKAVSASPKSCSLAGTPWLGILSWLSIPPSYVAGDEFCIWLCVLQERQAKKDCMNDAHAAAYISAGPIAADGALQNSSFSAITKESKVSALARNMVSGMTYAYHAGHKLPADQCSRTLYPPHFCWTSERLCLPCNHELCPCMAHLAACHKVWQCWQHDSVPCLDNAPMQISSLSEN